MTKLGPKRIHTVRVRGGNLKHRALRLETGNFAWGSERVTRKTRVIGVVYNSTNNELVRTNTLVKGAIIQIDATPFRQWYEAHYAQPVTKKGKVRIIPSVSHILILHFSRVPWKTSWYLLGRVSLSHLANELSYDVLEN